MFTWLPEFLHVLNKRTNSYFERCADLLADPVCPFQTSDEDANATTADSSPLVSMGVDGEGVCVDIWV